MHKRNLLGRRVANPIAQLVVIRMAAVTFDLLHMRPHRHRIPKELDRCCPVLNLPPGRAVGLVARDQKRVVGVVEVSNEVMPDAPVIESDGPIK